MGKDNYIMEIEGPTGEVFSVKPIFDATEDTDIASGMKFTDIDITSVMLMGLNEEVDIIDGLSKYTREILKDKIKAIAMKIRKEG